MGRHREIKPPPATKVHDGRHRAVGLKVRVPVDQRHRAQRLGFKQKAPGHDGVAADVVQSATADFRQVADVVRLAVEVGKKRLHRAQFTQGAAAHNLARAQPLRVKAHHEGLHDVHLARHFAQFFGLARVHGKGFFTQHVFACAGGGQRHGHMLVVGQRVVDGFNVGVGQQFIIGAVGLGDTHFAGHFLRLRQ